VIVLPAALISRELQNGQHATIGGTGSAGKGVPGSREREKDMCARWKKRLAAAR
jgi:hypothetical protein